MNVAELSVALQRMALETPEVALEPYADGILIKLTAMLFAELPDFPHRDSHVSIFRLAELCNVHVTMVARAIQGKVCRTSVGLIPYTQFITGMRK